MSSRPKWRDLNRLKKYEPLLLRQCDRLRLYCHLDRSGEISTDLKEKVMPNSYYVYILANKTNSTLYIGVTNNILRRTNEHNDKVIDSFTNRYNINKLVYIEEYSSVEDALNREKQLKKWRREKKDALINSINPQWEDLLLE